MNFPNFLFLTYLLRTPAGLPVCIYVSRFCCSYSETAIC